MREHGLYKYVVRDTKEIIYIGKSNYSLKGRIKTHNSYKAIDEKFAQYDGRYDVYVCYLPNSTEVNLMEKALINKYKPVLCVVDNHDGFSGLIQCEEPKWEKYKPQKSKLIKKKKTTLIQKNKQPFFTTRMHKVSEKYGDSIYLSDWEKEDDKRVPIFKTDNDAKVFYAELHDIIKKGEKFMGYIKITGKQLKSYPEISRVLNNSFANTNLYLWCDGIFFFIFGNIVYENPYAESIKEVYLYERII